MASNCTNHYQLCQWESTDQVVRTDFNADNAKVDSALAGHEERLSAAEEALETAYTLDCPQVVAGWYTGDGAEDRFIDLGFTPKALLLVSAKGEMNRDYSGRTCYFGGLALPGHNVGAANWVTGTTILAVVEDGFKVSYYPANNILTNNKGDNYRYLAVR